MSKIEKLATQMRHAEGRRSAIMHIIEQAHGNRLVVGGEAAERGSYFAQRIPYFIVVPQGATFHAAILEFLKSELVEVNEEIASLEMMVVANELLRMNCQRELSNESKL
jgi:hypothetical protein